MNITATTEGDLGDAVMLAAVLSIRGGKNTMLLKRSDVTKWRDNAIIERAYNVLAPLLEGVGGISRFGIYDNDKVDWKSQDFRWRHYRPNQTLFESHAQHLRDSVTGEQSLQWRPWLTVKPNSRFWNKWIVNRSHRHRNDLFPWHRLVASYGYKMVFVGTPDEHRDFCNDFGQVAYHETPTMLEVAQAIAGSQMFVGNQSSPHCVAVSLGHKILLETSLRSPDVCFGGKGAIYCYDGAIPHFSLPKPYSQRHSLPKSVVPPGFWQFPGFKPQSAFKALLTQMIQSGIPDAEASLLRENTIRIQTQSPSFFKDATYDLVESAIMRVA